VLRRRIKKIPRVAHDELVDGCARGDHHRR
jgi:hypothetical protein